MRQKGVKPQIGAHVALEQNQRIQLIACRLGRLAIFVIIPLLFLRDRQRRLGRLVALHDAVQHRLQRVNQFALLCVRVQFNLDHPMHLEVVVMPGGIQLGAQVVNQIRVRRGGKLGGGVIGLESGQHFIGVVDEVDHIGGVFAGVSPV